MRPGQDLKRDSIVAQSKTEYLEAFPDDFEVLKLEVRHCVDLKILPIMKRVAMKKWRQSVEPTRH